MAYIDAVLQFSDSEAVSSSGASADTVDIVDPRDIGPGRSLWVVVKFETPLGGTTPTFQVAVETDTASGFGSPTTIVTSQAYNPAEIVENNDQIVVGFPYNNEQFLRLQYTLSGAGANATVTSYLTDQEPYAWKSYPDAQN